MRCSALVFPEGDTSVAITQDPVPNLVLHLRARKANASRRGDTQTAGAVTRQLRNAKAEALIQKLVAEAPPLEPETRQRLAVILLSAGIAS